MKKSIETKLFVMLLVLIVMTMLLSACNDTTDNSDTDILFGMSSIPTEDTSLVITLPGVTSNDGWLTFSSAGGLFEESFYLSMSSPLSEGIIRYTVNGEVPSENSEQYSSSIHIYDRTEESNNIANINLHSSNPSGGGNWKKPNGNVFKGTVLRAAVFDTNGEMISEILTQSYFVAKDIFTRFGLPVVSLVTQESNLFGSSGIYTNYDNRGRDWERDVHMEFFEKDGTPCINQNLGMRINGGATRSMSQKSFRIYARDEYDIYKGSIKYELFPGLVTSYDGTKTMDKFKRLVLRSGGNDNNITMLRDSLMQTLIAPLNVETLTSRPCVAFVNGEFWGIYYIYERYDEHYFSNKYDLEREKVGVFEISTGATAGSLSEGVTQHQAFYDEVYSFFRDNTFESDEKYAKAQEYIDIDSLIDFYAANIFCGNTDWPGNNGVFWRYLTDSGRYDKEAVWYKDGRIRWAVKDLDYSFGMGLEVDYNMIHHAVSTESLNGAGIQSGADSTRIFRRCLQNAEFCERFINRLSDMMNTYFEESYIISHIDRLKNELLTAMPEHINRYPGDIKSMNEWNGNIKDLITYAQERRGYMEAHLKEYFGLGNTAPLKIQGGSGGVIINNILLDESIGVQKNVDWSGEYFVGTTQTISIKADSGKVFEKFIVTDNQTGILTEHTQSNISVEIGPLGVSVAVVYS